MCRARKSARHLEDQVTPILCVRLSAWEQRLAKLESSCGGAAHSPQNSRKQLHPAESSACSPASSSPLFSSSSSALLVWSCSLRAALRPLCARRFLLVFTRPERKKKRERESPSSSPPPLLLLSSLINIIYPSFMIPWQDCFYLFETFERRKSETSERPFSSQ